MHTNAAFNMTEYSTINHVNDSERQLNGFGCRVVNMLVNVRWHCGKRGPSRFVLLDLRFIILVAEQCDEEQN